MYLLIDKCLYLCGYFCVDLGMYVGTGVFVNR